MFSTNPLRANLQLKTYCHPFSPREIPQYTCTENLLFVLSCDARLGCRRCSADTSPFTQLTTSWDFSRAVLCVCSSAGQGPPARETVNGQGMVKSPVDENRSPCPRACGLRGISASQIWFDNHFYRLGGQQHFLKLWQYPCHRGA